VLQTSKIKTKISMKHNPVYRGKSEIVKKDIESLITSLIIEEHNQFTTENE